MWNPGNPRCTTGEALPGIFSTAVVLKDMRSSKSFLNPHYVILSKFYERLFLFLLFPNTDDRPDTFLSYSIEHFIFKFHVYLYFTFTYISSVPIFHLYLYFTCTYISSVPIFHVYLYFTCTYISRVPIFHVYLYFTCTYTSRVPIFLPWPSCSLTYLNCVQFYPLTGKTILSFQNK